MTRSLETLFRPRSVAVLGSLWAGNVIRECERLGFTGDIWPVHPKRDEIGGRACVRRLADLPGVPDAVFVGVNRDATLDVVAELAAMGAGGAICFAAGWSEAGNHEGQARLLEAAGEMPMMGPNCYGVLNYLDGAAIWPDVHGGTRVERGVAIISQSSNIAITLTMQRRGLPIAYVACLGNAAQCGASDVAAAVLADDRVSALGFYLEGVDDPAALAGVAEAARAAGKGVVALKGGRTEAGQAAAATHTASLAGGGAASAAFLAQSGIAQVETLADLVETLKILHMAGPLRGTRINSASCSGGEAGLVADLGDRVGVEFPPLTETAKARLFGALGEKVTLANPLDYHTYIWGDEEKTTEVFSAIAAECDAAFCVIDPPRTDRAPEESYHPAFNAIEAAAKGDVPVLAVSTLAGTISEALNERFMGNGVIPVAGLETALAAVKAAATPPGRPGWRPWAKAPERGFEVLDEAQGKALLKRAGVEVPDGVWAADLDTLAERAVTLRPPLALKGLGFLHKSEAGAVRLGLPSLEGQAEIDGAAGYLAEEMVQGGLAEVLVGLRRDPAYGATLTIGLGGVTAELLGDVVTRILPLEEAEVLEALRALKLWPLLDGFRGHTRPATDALVAAVMRLQALMAEDADLLEIEINPIILTEGRAVAADAVIRKAVT